MSASSKKKNLAKKTGWLEKKGDKGPVKIWRQRYFVETEKGVVQYFVSNDLTQDTYRGQIDLHDVLSVSKSIEVDVTQTEQNKLEFNVLVKSGRIYRLRVDTQDERKQWMTIFGSKLLRAREQQRPIPATTPSPEANQNFNTFDFHAHTMPAYVMKQLYEESQQQPQEQKHPGSKLERSHSAENARAQVVTSANKQYGKLSSVPIIVDLSTPNNNNNNNNLPHAYGLMPKPESLKAMKEQQRSSNQLSSLVDGYLHLIQHEPEKFLHVANNNSKQASPTGPPTNYERLSKYNLESSTQYEHYTNSRQSVDYTRSSGVVERNNEKELERLEKLLMEEESGRGSIYGHAMRSFLMEEKRKSENQTTQQNTQEISTSTKKSYNYGSLAAVNARIEDKESSPSVSPSANQGALKSNVNRRSTMDLYQPIPSSLSPPQTPVALAEEKQLRNSLDSQSSDKRNPEYGGLPNVRKSQLPPEVLAMLESARHNTPPSSPAKSPKKPTPQKENVIRVSNSDLWSSQEVDPAYLQLPSYDNTNMQPQPSQ